MKWLQLRGRASPGLPASFFLPFWELYLEWKVMFCIGMGAAGELCALVSSWSCDLLRMLLCVLTPVKMERRSSADLKCPFPVPAVLLMLGLAGMWDCSSLPSPVVWSIALAEHGTSSQCPGKMQHGSHVPCAFPVKFPQLRGRRKSLCFRKLKGWKSVREGMLGVLLPAGGRVGGTTGRERCRNLENSSSI